MRKLIGACIELRIRERRVFEDQRDSIRRALHLLFKQLMNAQMLRIRCRRVVPTFEQCVLLGQHEFMCVQRRIRLIERLLKQARKAFAQPCDGALIEQVGGVAERTSQSVLRMRQAEREIELGSSFGCGQQFQCETGQRERVHRRVLQHEHHLEQRRAAGVANWRECFDEFFKWQILMRVSGQRRITDLRKQIA
ncbi:hypothetical protein NK8_53280 (plasmid) [Caballeronia sp. NK8]|nr:hypothetical protein NK8_53280 [Caballeronia sp. NK8]